VATHYSNAPITEALIDIRVEPSAAADLELLESIHHRVAKEYPRKKKRLFVEGLFSAGEEIGASAKQTIMGFAFSSQDDKQIFQARRDGFTFSRLRPYGSWPELRDEARRLWDIYRESIAPQGITRVAVRYINQIDIPSLTDYKEYFGTIPEVAPVLPQHISNFFMQLHFPQPDFGGILILTQTVVPPPQPGMNSIVLDIDVFKQADMTSDAEIWTLLEKLRDKKNEFFEGCITEKTRLLFGDRKEY
jgi:uncharacterized protein (TIGR04255 family)